VIMAFGLEKPVFRILVNTMGTLGAVGLTTGLMPSMTLGAGGEGGSITGDNITVHHLYNVKRLAYEITPPPPSAEQRSHYACFVQCSGGGSISKKSNTRNYLSKIKGKRKGSQNGNKY